jgi:hypothetical protein
MSFVCYDILRREGNTRLQQSLQALLQVQKLKKGT